MPAPNPQLATLYAELVAATDPAKIAKLQEEAHALYLAEVFAANTPNGFPYPAPTDPVSQGADAIRALAEALDPRAPIQAMGFINISVTTSSATAAVTFPAGRFAVAPYVWTNLFTGAGGTQRLVARCWAATPTGASLGLWTGDGTATSASNLPVQWLAVAVPLVAVGLGLQAPMPTAFTGLVYATVTCTTEGCPNEDVPLELVVGYRDEETGETLLVGSVTCGVCGQPITDINLPEEVAPHA